MIFVRKFQVSRSKLLRIESKLEPGDSSKGGDGKSTVMTQIACMDSLQQRKKGKLKSLRSVDLWFTFLHLTALIHTQEEVPTPANFFSVKCVRFFVSTELEFPKIYRRVPKIAEVFGRLPKIFRRLLKITEGVERFSTFSKQGQ